MDAIILAGGFGTRLRRQARATPLKNLVDAFPKPLLPVGDGPLLDHILRFLQGSKAVERVYVVTNKAFFRLFQQWRWSLPQQRRGSVELICDPAGSEGDRLGSLGDLYWALTHGVRCNETLMVMASDSIFMGDDPLRWTQLVEEGGTSHILIQKGDPSGVALSSACVKLGKAMEVLSFEERPKRPKWPWFALPVHFYPYEVLEMLSLYIGEGLDKDQMGAWIPWLLDRGVRIRALEFKGIRIDCGDIDGYRRAIEVFSAR